MAVDYATLKKGGFMRQKQKNHFSLRLAVVGGQVSASQLAAITRVAEEYGKGYIHLTSRQGIEIPFIQLEDIDKVKEQSPVSVARESVPLLPVRGRRSVPTAVSRPRYLHRN